MESLLSTVKQTGNKYKYRYRMVATGIPHSPPCYVKQRRRMTLIYPNPCRYSTYPWKHILPPNKVKVFSSNARILKGIHVSVTIGYGALAVELGLL